MSQSPFQEQNVPVIEVCCLCGRPLSGMSPLLFNTEQGQARVDERCARALSDLALGWEPGKLGEALRYVQGYLPYTHPAVHAFLDIYIERGLRYTGQTAPQQTPATDVRYGALPFAQPPVQEGMVYNGQPSMYPQGMAQNRQPPVQSGVSPAPYPVMAQEGQNAAQPSAPFVYPSDVQTTPAYAQPPEESKETTGQAPDLKRTKRAAQRSERTERLFRVLARVVFSAIVGLAASLLSARGTDIPALPLVLGTWLTFAFTGGRWLFKVGYRIGMRFAETVLYPDGDPNLVLKCAAVVLSVLISLPFTAIVGAINGVIELYNTALKQNARELFAEDNPAYNRNSYNRH